MNGASIGETDPTYLKREAPLPTVTVIIPTRNEEKYLANCLDSIVGGSYPTELLEVLIVDGRSSDGTHEVAERYAKRFPFIRLLDNPARIVPHAMNIGIRSAKGEIIVRMDAHARYGRDYLVQLVTWMRRLNADNVGGMWVTVPAADSSESKAVALILSHRFGVGTALYRLRAGDEPIEVDTVPYGCYRRETFDQIGLYDELFVRNQDDELNARLKMAGGRIFLVPEIQIEYVARGTLRKMATMLYQYGYFKPLVAIKNGRPATIRQLAPPAFAACVIATPIALLLFPPIGKTLLACLGLHTAVNLAVSTRQSLRQGWGVLPFLLAGFPLAHLSYGIGYLKGIFDFGIRRVHRKRHITDLPLSR